MSTVFSIIAARKREMMIVFPVIYSLIQSQKKNMKSIHLTNAGKYIYYHYYLFNLIFVLYV